MRRFFLPCSAQSFVIHLGNYFLSKCIDRGRLHYTRMTLLGKRHDPVFRFVFSLVFYILKYEVVHYKLAVFQRSARITLAFTAGNLPLKTDWLQYLNTVLRTGNQKAKATRVRNFKSLRLWQVTVYRPADRRFFVLLLKILLWCMFDVGKSHSF